MTAGGGSMLEAFLQLLDGGVPREVVWTADLEYWISARRLSGKADPGWGTEKGFLELHRQLEIMPYYYYGEFWLAEPEYDDRIEVRVRRSGGRTRRIWSTPVGSIHEETTLMPESSSVAHTRHALSSAADLEVFLYLLEHRRLAPACIDTYRERRALWSRYGGLPGVAMPRSPLAALFYEWAGVENGVYLLADRPDLVEQAFALMAEQEEPVVEAVCELGPPLVHFADNMSGDNMAGLYDRLMAPVHRRRLERFHQAGVRCAVHLDGSMRGLLARLAALGFDAIEALTPQPAGDLAVEEIRQAAGSATVILWGGIPGVMFAPPYTWPQLREHVERVLAAWRGSPFVLGVGDQVPADGDAELCRRIGRLVRGHPRS